MFLKKHKYKIIAAVVIIAALAVAWFYSGHYYEPGNDAKSASASSQWQGDRNQLSAVGSHVVSASPGDVSARPSGTENDDAPTSAGNTAPAQQTNTAPGDPGNQTVPVSPESSVGGDAYHGNEGSSGAHEPDAASVTEEMPGPGTAPSEGTPSEETAAPATDAAPEIGQDRFQTDPVPDGNPLPVEPQDVTTGDGSFTVTLTVRCDTILDNMNLLNKEKHELVPGDGVIFPTVTVTAYEGESVFNVLQREMRRAGIHMAFRRTPIYNSAFIEAISNLYEFDVGELSGWIYCVTPLDTGQRWYPNYGCSRYQLKPGDAIEWNFTCDLGRDLGDGAWIAAGAQKDD